MDLLKYFEWEDEEDMSVLHKCRIFPAPPPPNGVRNEWDKALDVIYGHVRRDKELKAALKELFGEDLKC